VALSARLAGVAGWMGVVALGALAVGLVVAAPAGAHGGSAAFEVVEAEEVAPGEVELRVAITYESDGAVADGAIVEVVATGPSGEAEPSVRLEREAGGDAYAARLALPDEGAWALAISSSFPPGETEVEVEVGMTGDEPEAEGRGAAVRTAEGSTDDEPDGGGLEEPEAGGAEGGSDTTNLFVAGLSGLVGGGLGLWASRRRSARKRAAAVAPD